MLKSSLWTRLRYHGTLIATCAPLWLKHVRSRHETANQRRLGRCTPYQVAGIWCILVSLRRTSPIQSAHVRVCVDPWNPPTLTLRFLQRLQPLLLLPPYLYGMITKWFFLEVTSRASCGLKSMVPPLFSPEAAVPSDGNSIPDRGFLEDASNIGTATVSAFSQA